jgi:hypothetical protein
MKMQGQYLNHATNTLFKILANSSLATHSITLQYTVSILKALLNSQTNKQTKKMDYLAKISQEPGTKFKRFHTPEQLLSPYAETGLWWYKFYCIGSSS